MSKLRALERINFWWRLRSLWGATLAGFGWRRRSVASLAYSAYPPEPPWRRLWHVFRPAAPQPPVPPWTPPPWSGPPESELGVAVPLRKILVSDPGVVIALIDCVAFSNGFEFALAVRAREDISGEEMGFGPFRARGMKGPERQLQIGVQFGDGRKGLAGSGPGPEDMAYFKASHEGHDPSLPEGPILSPRGGGGGGKRWEFRYWVWPLPPEGTLTFTCEWPARKLEPTAHVIDAAEIRRAGAASTSLWSDT